LIRSFLKLSPVDPGINASSATTFRVSPPEAAYAGDEARIAFYDGLRERALAVPGVTAVATTLAVPPAGERLNLSFDIAGRPPHAPGTDPTLEVSVVDADYFGVMGIPVVRGRGFTADDRLSTPTTLVLTESAVRRYFPDEDPLGQHITLGWRRAGTRVGGEVVGVVRDVRSFGLDVAAPPQVYVSLSQVPISSVSVIARTGVDSSSVVPGLRAAVSAMDASMPLAEVATLEDHVRGSIAEQRLLMALLTAFAAVALVLAAVGIFGVLSYLVSQRTREIGLRMALGASRHSVIGLVLRRAVLLSGAGVAIGTVGALALSRTLQSLLFDLSATDPVTFVAVPACLMAVALFASWLPARRATGVDPLAALRD
jgi:putative ABC transport system permease protein